MVATDGAGFGRDWTHPHVLLDPVALSGATRRRPARSSWIASPFPAAALGLCVGAALALSHAPARGGDPWLFGGLAAAVLALVVAALARPRRWRASVHLALALATSAGGGLAASAHVAARDARMLESRAERILVATIDGPVRSGPRGIAVAARVEAWTAPTEAGEPGALMAVDHRLWLRLPGDPATRGLVAGDRVLVRAVIRGPHPQRAPGGFHERALLLRRGVDGVATALGQPRVLTRADGVRAALHRVRARAAARFEAAGGQGVLAALALGHGGEVEPEVRTTFARSGLAHVLAVSGLHFGLVALATFGGLTFALSWSRRLCLGFGPRRAAALGALPVLWAYVELVGAPVSAVRAFVMAACLLVGIALRREGHPEISLAVAAILIVGADPSAVLSPAFQLSFCAVLGLLWTQREWGVVVEPIYARLRGPAWWVGARVWIARSLVATAGASVATTPLVLVHFGQVPLLGGIANLWVVPAVSFALLPLAFLAAVLAWPLPTVAAWLVRLGTWLEWALTESVAIFDRTMPAVGTEVLPPPAWVLAVHALAALAVLRAPATISVRGGRRGRSEQHWRGCLGRAYSGRAYSGRAYSGRAYSGRAYLQRACARRPWAVLAVVCIAVLATWHAPSRERIAPGALAVTFIAIGQGDATLIEFPDGDTMLIDAGGVPASDFDTGARVVVPTLRAYGLDHVDILVLTHPDFDHMGGMPSAILALRPDEVWTNGDAVESPTWRAMIDAIEAVGATHVVVDGSLPRRRHGDALLEVVWPLGDVAHLERNDRSIVIRVELGDVSFLLPGDAEAGAEAGMLAHGRIAPATVLKAGHHGSRSSSSAAFLDAVAPRWMVHSVGEGNTFGFPHREVLARAAARGIPHLRTDTEGTIRMTTDGAALEVDAFYRR